MREWKMLDKPNITELEERIKNSYKDKRVTFDIIRTAFSLDAFEFVSINFSKFLSVNTNFLIGKEDNEIVIFFVKSNNKLKLYEENIIFLERYKRSIKFDYSSKGTILNHIAFSYMRLNKIKEASLIYSNIKHLDPYYFENYINCFLKLSMFEKALFEINKYIPKTISGKVWKVITCAEIYHKTDNLTELSKQYKKACEIYSAFSNSNKIEEHSCCLFLLGEFALKLDKRPQAILHYKNSILSCTEGLVDNLYREKSIKRLEEMGVRKS